MRQLKRWLTMALCLGVFVVSAYLLVTGSPWLERPAIESIGLPFGNLITWAGLVALPAAIYLVFRDVLGGDSLSSRSCRVVLKGVLTLAAAWGLVCFGLAGNWAFNFPGATGSFRGSEPAAGIFWSYTIGLVVLPWLMLPWLLGLKLAGLHKARSPWRPAARAGDVGRAGPTR